MATKTKQTEREEARTAILRLLDKENPRLYTVLRHVSRSGMTRDISVMAVAKDGQVWNVSYYAGLLLGWQVRDTLGSRTVRVSGCGMDMGFHLVYSLSHYLYEGLDRAGYVIRHEWM